MQKTWVRSLGWEDPLKEGMATHSSTLATDRGAWRATVHEVAESGTTETSTTECIIYNTIYTHTAFYVSVFYIFVLFWVKYMNVPAFCTIPRDTSIRSQAPK